MIEQAEDDGNCPARKFRDGPLDAHHVGGPFQEISRATLVERPGGHHCDGDYGDIARMILNRLTARQTAVR
jgi:type IV secretory pathway VirJ component